MSSDLSTSASPSRHEAIARALRGEILRGRFRPGDRLPAERDLALRLGAHRSSVREALRSLEQQGLVSIRHGGGATVRALREASLEVIPHMLVVDGRVNRPLLEQVLDVHELLVVGATRLAVERADDEARLEARELLARLADPDASDDAFLDTAAALLDLIVEASGNLVLGLARRAVNPLFEDRFREARKRFRPRPALLASLAAELDAAIAGRDADAAEEHVRRLLRLNRTRALDALEALSDPLRAPRPLTPQEDLS
jgi:GntR family transcriptional repressor for pyruvate dehydrogenase complex